MVEEEPKEREPKVVSNKEGAVLKKLAIDIFEGRVFTNRHLTNETDAPMVFMPIALGAFKDWSMPELQQVALIYEDLSLAGPRGINGNPMFTSFHMLNPHDLEIMHEHYGKYKEMKEAFNNG